MEHKRIIKSIVNYLNQNELKEVADKLQIESNIVLQTQIELQLKTLIQNESVTEAIDLVSKHFNNENDKEIATNLRIFNFIRLIRQGLRQEAIVYLREAFEIKTLDQKLLKQSAKLVFIKDNISKSDFEVKIMESFPNINTVSNFIKYLDSKFNEKNKFDDLKTVLSSVIKRQISACKYHNQKSNKFSYFFDHDCDTINIPNKLMTTIEEHNEEISNIVFSHNARYFAITLAKSNRIAIYSFSIKNNRKSSNHNFYTTNNSIFSNQSIPERQQIDIYLVNVITAHQKSINSIVWNSLDTNIITASKDKTIKIWDPFTGVCKHSLENQTNMVTNAIYIKNQIVAADLDYKIYVYSMDAKLVRSIQIPDISISEVLYSEILNILVVIAATSYSIVLYDIEKQIEIEKLQLNDVIVSSAISRQDQGLFLLINNSHICPALNLIDLRQLKIINKYFGHRQERFSNRCNFGGINENFLLCGSEDANLYIWNRNSPIPISCIKIHSSPVNCIVWPTNYTTDIIASVSDDNTVKFLSVTNAYDKFNINYGAKRSMSNSTEGKFFEALGYITNEFNRSNSNINPAINLDEY